MTRKLTAVEKRPKKYHKRIRFKAQDFFTRKDVELAVENIRKEVKKGSITYSKLLLEYMVMPEKDDPKREKIEDGAVKILLPPKQHQVDEMQKEAKAREVLRNTNPKKPLNKIQQIIAEKELKKKAPGKPGPDVTSGGGS